MSHGNSHMWLSWRLRIVFSILLVGISSDFGFGTLINARLQHIYTSCSDAISHQPKILSQLCQYLSLVSTETYLHLPLLPAFSPVSRVQLKSAVDVCLKLSPQGNCFNGPHGPIGTWGVSRVTDMSRMFANAKFFDSDLSKWDVSRVKNMRGMFLGATSFNGDVSKWDVSSVRDMSKMFWGATLFKRRLCGTAWIHSKATQTVMFEGSSGSISPEVCTVTAVPIVFSPQSRDELKRAVDEYLRLSPKGQGTHGPHGPIGEWDVSRITDLSRMFADVTSFNGDISKWDVSSVKDMNAIFSGVTSFNGDLSQWDVSRVTDMSHMFATATSFNGDISKWDVSSAQEMGSMFWGATSFNGDLSKWDVSHVTGMTHMFADATLFSNDVSKWDVSSVQDMSSMFWGAKSFNGDLSKWDTSSAQDISSMFWSAKLFNGDISKWDVSRVTDMSFFLYGAVGFTQELCTGGWANSKAEKRFMFEFSSGSISSTQCLISPTPSSLFSPQSKHELKGAVDTYIQCPAKRDDHLDGPESTRPAKRLHHVAAVTTVTAVSKSSRPTHFVSVRLRDAKVNFMSICSHPRLLHPLPRL